MRVVIQKVTHCSVEIEGKIKSSIGRGLLVLVGTHIDATNRATNVLKNKVSIESPYAANKISKYENKAGQPTDLPSSDVKIEVKVGSAEVKIDGKKYSTEDIITDGLSDADKEALKKKANGNLNLQFVEFEPVTPAESTPETPAEGTPETPAEGTPETPADTNANS